MVAAGVGACCTDTRYASTAGMIVTRGLIRQGDRWGQGDGFDKVRA